MENRSRLHYFWVMLKGMAMGAADVVPGVSGGTIAFISGIYEELITSIDNIRPSLLRVWSQKGFAAFWSALNGNFLLALFAGIAISVLSLSRVLSYLLAEHPVLLWAFFFGLVLASIIYVARQINRWRLAVWVMLLAGIALATLVVSLPAADPEFGLAYLFLCGALAICAMILPGISGAFILVLLGGYKTALDAIHERDLAVLLALGLGAVFGLLSFARLLKWMFVRFRNGTLAILTGFIIGSLQKIWPWKQVLETRMFDDKAVVIREANVAPWDFEGNPMLWQAILLAALGFALIFLLERVADRKNATD